MTMLRLVSHEKEEIFKAVCDGLASQGWKRSVTANNDCVYVSTFQAGNKPLHCAGGYAIHPEDRDRLFYYNRLSWDALILERIVPRIHETFIERLQLAHDTSREINGPQNMWEEFRKLAQRWDFPFDYPKPGINFIP